MRKTFAEWVARVLNFTDGALALGAKPTSGQVLRYDGTSITGATMGGGGTPTPTAAGDMIGTTDGAAWVKRTVAQVRDDLNVGAGAINPSSPYTVAAGVEVVTLTSSKTVAPRALSNYQDGQRILVVNDSTGTITATITPADGTIDGASSVALSVPAHGVVGCVRTSSSTWGSLQPSGLSTSWRALRVYISGGTLVGQEYAQSAAGLVAIGSAVTATVETGSSAEVTFSGANATIKAGIGFAGGGAAQSAPYKAYVKFTSLSATFQALLTTGARIAFYAQQSAIAITGVATAQWYGVLTGGLSGGYNNSAETFMAIAFRQGASAATARTLNGFSSAIPNMPASNAYATWSGIVGLGLSSGNAEMLANSTSGYSTVGTQTGATAPSAALDAVYWNATGVTSSPLVDVLVTAPELWLTVESRPA